MLLQDKTALVFGASGAIGNAVVLRFAAEGAHVFASSRSNRPPTSIEIGAPASGWMRVDATREDEVAAYVGDVATTSGRIDVVFNAIGLDPLAAAYATPSPTLPRAQFLLPLDVIVWSQFLTARTAAPYMLRRGAGSIVMLSASLSGQFIPYMAGITAACGAVEALSRTLAAEFGPAGVRVNCVRAGGMPETPTISTTSAQMAQTAGDGGEHGVRSTSATVLRRPLRLSETAATVAWVASDAASGMAGQVVNVCAGAIVSR